MWVRGIDTHRPSLLDVLDRVLDKGIVIEAHVGCALGGIALASVDARVRVRSLQAELGERPPATVEPVVEAVGAYLEEARSALAA